MTKTQIKKHNLEIMQWVNNVLKGKYGIHIANMLFALKQLTDEIEREEYMRRK